MDKYIGKLLDNRYEMLEVRGVGGMAVVYKARDRVLDRFVAIKIMKEEFANDEEFRRRFHNESQAVAKLSHNNIVSVYDVSQGSGVQYIVMELIDGITLKDYLVQKGRLSWQETLFFAQQISKALSHAHSRGIIHQDIKPHNIILLRDGTVKVTDFGIARFEKNQETRVIQEAIGSVHYISPEQAKGSRINHCADLYSLGIVMYECLTGKVPFDGDTPLAIVMQHMNAQAPLPSQIVPEIPQGMDDIVMHAMCPVLSQRYQSADEIYDDLERLKNNPRTRFSSVGAAARTPGAGTTDETIAIPRAARQAQPPANQNNPGRRAGYNEVRRDSRDQVYRPQPAQPKPAGYDDEEDERPRRKSKKKRSVFDRLSDSPAAMAGIAVAVFAVIAVGVAIFMISAGGLFAEKLTVPNLIGMQYDAAVEQYGTSFQIQKNAETREDPNAQPGEILEQTPEENTKLKKNGIITVTLCAEPQKPMDDDTDTYVLPTDLVGMNYEVARLQLKSEGIDVRVEHQGDLTVEKDKIIKTDPEGGVSIKKDTTVIFYVSDGPDEVDVSVPRVIGKTIDEATTMLKDAYLEVNFVEVDSDKPAGEVLTQSKDADTKVKANTIINLTVSNGKSADAPDDQDPDQQDPDNPTGNDQPQPPVQGQGIIQVTLPANGGECQVTIEDSKGHQVESKSYPADGSTISFTVYGEVGSSETYSIFINGDTFSDNVKFKAP